jgi:RNA polymerase sigma-70 factor (ECF subfamily)
MTYAGRIASAEDAAVLATIRAGDQAAFAALVERYRRELQVHCYRMLGSVDDAEDLVQETFLRAWRGRASFEGRSLLRTWLYRIATNACLNALERAPRRIVPQDVAAPVTAGFDASQARAEPPWAPELPWLQPYPDARLEPVAPSATEPEWVVVTRETVELAFLAALQHLPPRQRAILLLVDLLDWSARETAEFLETSLASVNSALQRARATMRTLKQVGSGREPELADATERERAIVEEFVAAFEQADVGRLAGLLREDARWAMPPAPLWFAGRAAIIRAYELFPIDWRGRRFRMLPTGANRQPATAAYVREASESTFHFSAVHVLRIERGAITEVTTFAADLCRAFDLPRTL